jgi:hypothetical protein
MVKWWLAMIISQHNMANGQVACGGEGLLLRWKTVVSISANMFSRANK